MIKLIVLSFLVGFAASRFTDLHQDNTPCKDHTGDDYFRLSEDNCRQVARCSEGKLMPLQCTSGLVFDVERQVCDWRFNVKNCKQMKRTTKAMPQLNNGKCGDGKLACGSGECIPIIQFCDGQRQCVDGSDENICTPDLDPNGAPSCDTSTCLLPNCFCSVDGTQIPGKIEPKATPQMVIISFDDAVNNNNIAIYDMLFRAERRNPNNCTLKGTFFVSHKYSNYSAIQELHRRGHEIAVHSITHLNNETYWDNLDEAGWKREMVGARDIIARFANISKTDIVGMRSPFLRIGGNNQFSMLEKEGFLYDSSMTAPMTPTNMALWPYTLDYQIPHDCYGNHQSCPTRSHKVWEMIMNEFDPREDSEFDEPRSGCAMVDSCGPISTEEQFINMLNNNFNQHYDSNRAPLGLFFHASWLDANQHLLSGLDSWIDTILQNKDVYFVTMKQAIQWMQTPKSSPRDFAPWKEKCDESQQLPYCNLPNNCALDNQGETVRLQTCVECPMVYPWLDNPEGKLN